MAVTPIQFLVASNATITDGSTTVNVTGNVDCSRVFSGTAVFLGGADNPAEAISGTSPDGNGNSTITLRNNWNQGDVINQSMVTFNTNEGLAEAISNVREIVSNVSAIEDLTSQGLLKRIDDNTYEIVDISSQGESLITANDASTQRSVMGLGSAATRDVGINTGDILEVGAGGLLSFGALSRFPNNDVNDLTSSGKTAFFGVSGSDTGNPTTGVAGNVLNVSWTTSSGIQMGQLFMPVTGQKVKYRGRIGGNFEDWVTFVYENSDGNVGVNTTNPQGVFHVRTGGSAGVFISRNIDDDGSTGCAFAFSTTTTRARLGASGGLDIRVGGIGVAANDQQNAISIDSDKSVDFASSNVTIQDNTVYHSGNTNFNEFSANNLSDIIATGQASGSSAAVFYLPINSINPPASITASNSGFRVIRGNIAIANNVTPTINGSSSSNKVCVIIVSGLSGLIDGENLQLGPSNSSASITVNF